MKPATSSAPVVQSAHEARREKKKKRSSAARARKQERKQEALSRQEGTARGLRQQHHEEQQAAAAAAEEEEEKRERGSAARVVGATERLRRAPAAQVNSAASPESMKSRGEGAEIGVELRRGKTVDMAAVPMTEDKSRVEDGSVTSEASASAVATATIATPTAAVVGDGEGRAAAAKQKRTTKRKEARLRRREQKTMAASAAQDRVGIDPARNRRRVSQQRAAEPDTSNPSPPLTPPPTATESVGEKRPKKGTEQKEDLGVEAWRGGDVARQDARAASRHQTSAAGATAERVGASRSERRGQAARVIGGACRTYLLAKRVAGAVTAQHSRKSEEPAGAATEVRAGEAGAIEEAPDLATEEATDLAAEGQVGAGDEKTDTPRSSDHGVVQEQEADKTATVPASAEADGGAAEAAEHAPATKGEQEKPGVEAERAEWDALENRLLAKAGQALKEKQSVEAAAEAGGPAAEPAERTDARPTEDSMPSDPPPPAGQQPTVAAAAVAATESPPPTPPSPDPTEASTPSYVSHPLQVVEGRVLLYDPREFNLWELMTQLRGWTLALGAAPVWGGCNYREAEAFSAVCGFSAALGPIVLKRVATAVYGRAFSVGVSVLSSDHVVYAFGRYWDADVAPHDPTERFFRLVKVGSDAASGVDDGMSKVAIKRTMCNSDTRVVLGGRVVGGCCAMSTTHNTPSCRSSFCSSLVTPLDQRMNASRRRSGGALAVRLRHRLPTPRSRPPVPTRAFVVHRHGAGNLVLPLQVRARRARTACFGIHTEISCRCGGQKQTGRKK